MPAGSLRFDRFELQPQERRLLADGAPVTLGARAFDLLLAMAARPGQLLTKAELLDAVWPGLVVEEANLSVQVSTLRKVLGDKLIATIPGRGYRFTGTPSAIAASAGVPPVAAPAPRADRPAPARTLVDREAELARIDEILRVPGLVTLTGPAGVGKTALARALAARDARQPLWVDLAPLAYAGQVLAATARALGVSLPEDDPLPPVLRALEGRLLVLDNAEHLVEAVATFAANVLAAAPAQHILVTSQLPLRVAGEQLVRIEPLALPLGSDALDLHRGAVALFVERAHAADQRFHAGPTNLPLLREICRRLDGLPLALEMAAARVPVLGLAGLRDALEQRWSLLTAGRRDAPARHRTLQAALDWSYGLLAPAEQRLFRICSVFRGGFTLDLLMQVAAEGAAADAAAGSTELAAGDSGYAVIDALSQLVEGSLVASDASEPPRFALLESMREYARQKLATSGEEEAVRSRHAHAYARVAAAANAGGERERVLMLAEHHNLREALTWLRTREPARAVEMVTQVARIATFSAWRMDGLRWLESFAVEAADPSVPPVVRAHWVHERARQLLMNRDPRARSLAQYARSLYRRARRRARRVRGARLGGARQRRGRRRSRRSLRRRCGRCSSGIPSGRCARRCRSPAPRPGPASCATTSRARCASASSNASSPCRTAGRPWSTPRTATSSSRSSGSTAPPRRSSAARRCSSAWRAAIRATPPTHGCSTWARCSSCDASTSSAPRRRARPASCARTACR